jgi:hypothetical protein
MKWIACAILLNLQTIAWSQEYFPKDMFVMKDCYLKQKDNIYKYEDYSGKLELLKQPSLFKNDVSYSIYRFLWMPSFDTLTVITFNMKTHEQWVQWSKGYYEGNNSDGEMAFKIISGYKKLYDLDSVSMNHIMNDLGFWKDHPMGPCSLRMGFMDGSEWLFEAREGNRYKCVSRSNPGQDSKYYLLGLLFFKAAKIDKELVDIY